MGLLVHSLANLQKRNPGIFPQEIRPRESRKSRKASRRQATVVEFLMCSPVQPLPLFDRILLSNPFSQCVSVCVCAGVPVLYMYCIPTLLFMHILLDPTVCLSVGLSSNFSFYVSTYIFSTQATIVRQSNKARPLSR